MRRYLNKLEERLNKLIYTNEKLNSENKDLSQTQKVIGKYKVFGDNILEVPEIKFREKYGKYSPMSIPFRFFDFKKNDIVSYQQFKSLIPSTFQLIGFLNTSKIVAVNEKNNKIHTFHYSDLADLDQLNYLIKTPICAINGFLRDMRPQTIICLTDPQNSARYERLKIDGSHLFHEIIPSSEEELSTDFIISEEDIFEEYFRRIALSLKKGYKILYAPEFVWKNFFLEKP